MKRLLFIIAFLTCNILNAQLPYTWTAGVNPPGWVSTNSGSGGALQWQAGCSVVTINCATYGTPPLTPGGYANNAFSEYTSPTINATCTNASTISITFRASGNAQYVPPFGYDFLFVEYSLNGGTTWINPYGVGVGWTGNFGFPPGSTIPPIVVPTSANFRFRFRFDSDNTVTYNGYSLLDFDVVCNVVLPVELVDFRGESDGNRNKITWITSSEINNDYFTLYESKDAVTWNEVSVVDGAGNSNTELTYTSYDESSVNGITYYKLEQTDFDGMTKLYGPIVVKNDAITKTIIKVCDLQGREYGTSIPENQTGLFFVIYDDNSCEKVFVSN